MGGSRVGGGDCPPLAICLPFFCLPIPYFPVLLIPTACPLSCLVFSLSRAYAPTNLYMSTPISSFAKANHKAAFLNSLAFFLHSSDFRVPSLPLGTLVGTLHFLPLNSPIYKTPIPFNFVPIPINTANPSLIFYPTDSRFVWSM